MSPEQRDMILKHVAAAENITAGGVHVDAAHALASHIRDLLAENERLQKLPDWIISKLKRLGEYYQAPTDGRDVVGEIQGWTHVLCFHYVQNRRQVKEYDAARRNAKELQVALIELVTLQSHYAGLLNQCDGGVRHQFANADEWLARLKELGKLPT